jgi:hypothetical protein
VLDAFMPRRRRALNIERKHFARIAEQAMGSPWVPRNPRPRRYAKYSSWSGLIELFPPPRCPEGELFTQLMVGLQRSGP